MRRRSPGLVPPDLRSRLEQARLDTLALIRALDQAPLPRPQLPQPYTDELFELDADCAEALWALDQPPGSLDFKAMVRDTLASLDKLPQTRQDVRARLPPALATAVTELEKALRSGLGHREAYSDVPGRDPNYR
ncbi:MAG: hypothetical protein MUF10_20095 [Thermoanaerobaculaceae bacterium]|nr:hypothetical protein [Thermoanaerobaculaceae bacterium]